jgi:hypothetical protein
MRQAKQQARPDARFFCPKCSYDLFGLPENRCPECGTPFDPATLAHRFPRPMALDALLARLFWPNALTFAARVLFEISDYLFLLSVVLLVLALIGLLVLEILSCWHIAERRFVRRQRGRIPARLEVLPVFILLYLLQLFVGMVVLYFLVLQPIGTFIQEHPPV